jgi:glycosyltransferase involved in cell wall biosynthesis
MVLPSLDVGGMERVTIDLARGLCERGWHSSIICVERPGHLANEAASAGIDVAVVKDGGMAALTRIVRRRAPDIVHVHMTPWLRAALAAKTAGSTVVFTLHGMPERLLPHDLLSMRCAAQLTGAVICVSPPLRRFAVRALGVTRGAASVIRNGVDTGRYGIVQHGNGLRRELGISAAARVVGTVARLAPVKNQALLLRAIALCPSDVHLVVAGDGECRQSLETLANSLNIGPRVHFLGNVKGPEIVYGTLDAFCLTSDAEGTPVSVLEAMACGVPVVATSVGGIPRLLNGGRLGRLVAPGDERAFSDALCAVLGHESTIARRAAQDALALVTEHYSIQAMVDAHITIYESVLGSRRR